MNDKLLHAIAGALTALFAALAYALIALALPALGFELPIAGLIPVPFIGALFAGLVKEAADWLDNRTAPGTHTVDPWDVVATAAPGLVISVVVALAVR